MIEKASGLPLDQFLRTRIFEPLRMTDTSFFLPPGKRDRLATVYSIGPDGTRVRAPGPKTGQGEYVDGPRACFSGGAGLLSTAGDDARFLQMLLNGGELDDARLLSPKSVELMTANHIGTLYREDGSLGFGLGFEATLEVGASGRPGSVGTYRRGSACSSTFWVDPTERIISIFLTQLIPAGDVDLQDKLDYLTCQLVRWRAAGKQNSRPARIKFMRTDARPGPVAGGRAPHFSTDARRRAVGRELAAHVPPRSAVRRGGLPGSKGCP